MTSNPFLHPSRRAGADTPTVLAVADLSFTYANRTEPALQAISFTIQKGEIFGFLGPSGAGKSTTQKILMGLLRGYQGRVEVFGRPLSSLGAAYYERIGVSFELPNHYQKLTALENLQFFRSLYSGETEDPMTLLQAVGLAEDARVCVSQFSKGMQSRLTFVRALLNRPELLFLDEPTAGLDSINARLVKDIIRKLRTEGRTIFLTTHDMHVADELCDRVALLTHGRIRLIDTPRELKLRQSQRLVSIEHCERGQLMHSEFPLDDLAENETFLQLLKRRSIETMHTKEATLEDIFIQVTGEALL
jgi:fluoroquinolone transport system ATP-binding protein